MIVLLTTYYNPCSYASRASLLQKFVKHAREDLRLPLVVVKASPHFPDEVQVYFDVNDREVSVKCSGDALWLKENLLNIGLKYLPEDCTHVCWCDADIFFVDAKSFRTRLERCLQTHQVVQCFSTAVDEGGADQVTEKVHHSAAFSLQHGVPNVSTERESTFHSGYCWAASTASLSAGFFEGSVVGGGDRLFLRTLVEEDPPEEYVELYGASYLRWRQEFLGSTGGRYLPGCLSQIIHHGFHGKKKNRGYHERYKVLRSRKYDPALHLTKRPNGVIDWSPECPPQLVRDVRAYFVSRREDEAQL